VRFPVEDGAVEPTTARDVGRLEEIDFLAEEARSNEAHAAASVLSEAQEC